MDFLINESSIIHAGSLLTFLAAIILALKHPHLPAKFSLISASALTILWSITSGITESINPQTITLLILIETLRYSAWIYSELDCLKEITNRKLEKSYQLFIFSILFAIPSAFIFLLHFTSPNNIISLYVWNSLILSVVALSTTEQLYRNSKFSRLTRILSLSLGCLFIYDIYFFAHSLIFNTLDPDLWTSRGIVNLISGLLFVVGLATLTKQNNTNANLFISRPIIFYSTTLTMAGIFLGLMATGGYYVQNLGGKWDIVIQTAITFGSIVALGIILISERAKSKLNVWINKNFFNHKYDYRVEWLKLIDNLSRPINNQSTYERAILAMITPFKCDGGAIWIKRDNTFSNLGAFCFDINDINTRIAADSAFINYMTEQEWVLTSDEIILDKFKISPPAWLSTIKDLWLIVPLINESHLTGFIALKRPLETNISITWEDLDLLKTIGKQLANYIERHEAAEALAQARQFDAFHKLTAFIIHDLKNLIAQQALVVANAEKHKDNPAFFEDAIKTIDNSVTRMNTLLKKLQHNEPNEHRTIHLQKALIEAVKKCKDRAPTPSLRLIESPIYVNADFDRLIMALHHLIRNAQEATTTNGFVDVILEHHNNIATITVIDNGTGMSQEFIKTDLFKPFATTKSGKGMGIGAFQVKEFVTSLGGELSVTSQESFGTTFTISLPVSNH